MKPTSSTPDRAAIEAIRRYCPERVLSSPEGYALTVGRLCELALAHDSASSERAEMTDKSAVNDSAAIPEEFAQLARFYGVSDMTSLVRIQAEHIERLQKKLPPLRGPESDPQNYRRG